MKGTTEVIEPIVIVVDIDWGVWILIREDILDGRKVWTRVVLPTTDVMTVASGRAALSGALDPGGRSKGEVLCGLVNPDGTSGGGLLWGPFDDKGPSDARVL